MARSTIAVLFGGCSEEHDVSVKSAMEIAASVDEAGYDAIYVGITRSGVWMTCERPGPAWEDGDCRPAVISPDRSTHGLLVEDGGGWRAVRLDAVFPVLHGRFGEDGAVQGLLELSGIPYVGCDVQSSAICMDKSLAYVVARGAGIATPEFRVVTEADPVPLDELEYPVFVKPARSGSSFGVSKVDGPDRLDEAIRDARRFDAKVLVEQAVPGTEVGCAVLGSGSDLVVGEVDRIELSHGIFRIHQETDPEQGSENAVITIPAPVSDEQRDRIRATATDIYSALGCSGLARVDMFLLDDGSVVLNEVNTLPGFTSYSRYPRMMAAAGIDGPELVDRCLSSAMGR
ncbi:D-alanine--(R)-lactate ligase [Dermatobacter hominis]|uniref:D-alanine--(R)-lactate ligase n=1 Tax=Dermatobacter hominis TaxID=2884263 RepID=UPI001D10137A|nr:D-alanine--(R)-lactate ligase [Dermatobacter hominis]UDY37576.1 D-alanine--(R)-lactate ligase [Dermatobacter hominis]